MEDLEAAIHRLNLALDEHFTLDRTSMVTLGDQNNIHDTLDDLLGKVKVIDELIMAVGNLEEIVTTLSDTMKEIVIIQARALKWQEMTS